jgi:hypothetical protein
VKILVGVVHVAETVKVPLFVGRFLVTTTRRQIESRLLQKFLSQSLLKSAPFCCHWIKTIVDSQYTNVRVINKVQSVMHYYELFPFFLSNFDHFDRLYSQLTLLLCFRNGRANVVE